MLQQIRAIAWAQFRTMRNHLPRTNVGTVLLWALSLLWYGMYAALAVFFAIALPDFSLEIIRQWLPVALLAVFAFWQIVPLFTLSTGWSLQLNKLQIYPVSNAALFGIETLLRVTTAPEMILVLMGGMAGLLRHPGIPLLLPLFLLLFIPLNLFLSLGIRELILHSFERNRFRELFAVLIISITVVPQLLARTALGRKLAPYLLTLARGKATPWHQVASLSVGPFSPLDLLLLAAWTALCFALAKWEFAKGLRQDEGFQSSASFVRAPAGAASKRGPMESIFDLPSRLFRDPLGALLQKEFQSLVRMPRFRVMFGMACIFSVVIFVPVALNNAANGRDSFISNNFLPVVTLYGLLLMSDMLLLNVFGFDRRAVQIYFVTPVPFATVLKAKNLVAIAFIALQASAVLIIAALLRLSITPFNIVNAIAAAAVVGVYFLSIGNLSSIAMARPIDPAQTFRKQSGGKMQLWFLLSSAGMFLLVGFAFLARWALQTNWALLGVLLLEFAIGIVVYRIATESAVERGLRDRERVIEALSKGSSPIGLGLS